VLVVQVAHTLIQAQAQMDQTLFLALLHPQAVVAVVAVEQVIVIPMGKMVAQVAVVLLGVQSHHQAEAAHAQVAVAVMVQVQVVLVAQVAEVMDRQELGHVLPVLLLQVAVVEAVEIKQELMAVQALLLLDTQDREKHGALCRNR